MAFIKMLFTSFAHSITSLFFIAVVMLAYMHIRRNAQLEEYWLGILRNPVGTQLANVVFFGMLIGLMASFLIVIIGITIDYQAILFIWPLALILMLFNQRYMCFSYAGGIVSLLSLITGWPKIDVSAIIALIGILHLMESVLIMLDGHRDGVPVWMEHSRFKPVGAYLFPEDVAYSAGGAGYPICRCSTGCKRRWGEYAGLVAPCSGLRIYPRYMPSFLLLPCWGMGI